MHRLATRDHADRHRLPARRTIPQRGDSPTRRHRPLLPRTPRGTALLAPRILESSTTRRRMRESAQRSFVNIARRVQAIVHQQASELREMEEDHGRNPEVFDDLLRHRPRHRADRPARRQYRRARRRPPRAASGPSPYRCSACCAARCPGSWSTSGSICTRSPRSPSSARPSSRSSTRAPNSSTTPPATRRRRPASMSPRSRCRPGSPSRSRTAASASARRRRDPGRSACSRRRRPVSTSTTSARRPGSVWPSSAACARCTTSRSRCGSPRTAASAPS